MSQVRAKLWRRIGYTLFVLGALPLLARELLPIDLFVPRVSQGKHVFFRVVPAAGPDWYWWCCIALLVGGVAAILRSRRLSGR